MTIDCKNIELKKTSTGTKVKEVQQYLTNYGYYDGNIDGNFGDITTNSVKNFQKDMKLTNDGIIGEITCKKLNSLEKIGTNLKNGSSGEYVVIVQNKLKKLGYYTASIDGEYGTKSVNSVKSYQKDKKLAVDGIVGEVTYNALLKEKSKTSTSTVTNGVYTNSTYCEKSGGDCLGQITGYHCGPHSIKQALRKLGITGYSEKTIGSYAGTTTNGTGHSGLETAIATIARKEKVNLKVSWKNLSDLGSSQKSRFKAFGELMTKKDTSVFLHLLYRNKYGHYELIKTVNTDNSKVLVPNSLGNKCSSPAYCGYMETRTYSTEASYIAGISQKSICIISKV